MPNTNFNAHQPRRPARRKYILLAALSVIVVVVAGLFLISSRNPSDGAEIEVTPAADTPGAEGDSGKTESKKVDSEDNTLPPDNISSAASLTITEQTSTSSGVRVAAVASGLTPTRCIFSFSAPESRPVVKETDATDQTCGPIDVASVEFDKIGEWNISVTAFNPQARVVTEGKVMVQ